MDPPTGSKACVVSAAFWVDSMLAVDAVDSVLLVAHEFWRMENMTAFVHKYRSSERKS
jgi:hypothetical protein